MWTHCTGTVIGSAKSGRYSVTFGDDNPAGLPARHFYQALGFEPAETAPPGPEGGSRQVFRLVVGSR